jgi:hypothetical protein
MLIQAHRKLGLVNADVDGWAEQVREYIENGCNFFLIIRKDPESVKSFCRLFNLPDDCKPHALTQGQFFLMSQFVDADAFDSILHHWNDKHQLIFVEQIDFPMNRPPKLKHFIVYSPVLGIIAQYDRLNRAKEVLEDYEDTAIRGAPNAEAAVYMWEKGRWTLFEGR